MEIKNQVIANAKHCTTCNKAHRIDEQCEIPPLKITDEEMKAIEMASLATQAKMPKDYVELDKLLWKAFKLGAQSKEAALAQANERAEGYKNGQLQLQDTISSLHDSIAEYAAERHNLLDIAEKQADDNAKLQDSILQFMNGETEVQRENKELKERLAGVEEVYGKVTAYMEKLNLTENQASFDMVEHLWQAIKSAQDKC